MLFDIIVVKNITRYKKSLGLELIAHPSLPGHTHTQISRGILSHSKVFAHNSKPSATLFVPQRYLTLICTKDLSSYWSPGAQTGWRTLLLSCYGVCIIPAQLLWLECCSSEQGSIEPVLMLLEMKMCKQKPPRGWRRARLPTQASCP